MQRKREVLMMTICALETSQCFVAFDNFKTPEEVRTMELFAQNIFTMMNYAAN